MIRFPAACAALWLVLMPGVGVGATAPPAPATVPGTTQIPQGDRSGLVLTTLDNKIAYERSQAAIGRQVGDHVLLDRRGKPVRLADYKGKPLLVNFIYTACFHVCPTTTRNLQKAVENTVAMLGANRFHIVSIGFNQPFDSPEAMKAFSHQHGINLPNWEFLSPAAAIVGELTADFGFSYATTTAGFDHLNQVSFVDAEGRIVRQVYGESFTAEDIAEPLKRMVTGAPLPPQTGTIEELANRLRIICSVYDPLTGRYRTNYALYFEIAGFISFVFFLGWVAWSFTRKADSSRIRSG